MTKFFVTITIWKGFDPPVVKELNPISGRHVALSLFDMTVRPAVANAVSKEGADLAEAVMTKGKGGKVVASVERRSTNPVEESPLKKKGQSLQDLFPGTNVRGIANEGFRGIGLNTDGIFDIYDEED